MAARRATKSARTTTKPTKATRGSRTTGRTTKTAAKATRSGTTARTSVRKTTTRTTKTPSKATVTLTTKTPKQAPWTTVTPHLVIDGCSDAMAWYTKVFGAKELSRQSLPNGRLMHASMQLGDAAIMLADSFGPAPEKMAGVTLHIQDPNINAMWSRAVTAGAKVEMPLEDQFWGDRYGQLRDPWGHLWSFGWPAKMTETQKEQKRQAAFAMMSGQ